MAESGTKWPQYLAAATVNLAAMSAGCVLGWSSPTLPRLSLPDSFLPITEEQASWIGSLASLGAAVGPFPAGYLAGKIGRKWTMLSLVIPFILGWILIAAAQSVAMIYVARVVAGIGIGAVFAVAPMYLGEIAEDNIRGALGSLFSAFVSVGLFYSYVIGPYVSYTWFVVALIVIPCVFAVSFFFMPDSPYYLLMKGEREKASEALQWLRGKSSDNVTKELDLMQVSVDQSRQQSGSFKDLFTNRGNIKALYLSLGLVSFQQLSGFSAIIFYSTDIFRLAGGSLSSDVSSIIVGAVLLVSGFWTPFLIERLGRRALLFISATGMAIGQLVLGVFFYLKLETDADLSSVGWLPIVCQVANMTLYSTGLGPLPWAIVGEIFPSNIKGTAAALSASCNSLIGFLIAKFFQNIVGGLGSYTAFWIFAGFCLLADVFVYFLLPETKGRSLQEIQDTLNKKR